MSFGSDKAFISSSWEIERGYIRQLAPPDHVELDERGVLRAVHLTHQQRMEARRRMSEALVSASSQRK